MEKEKNKRISPFDFPFQFILKINGHIICQRGFNIKNFNKKVLLSYELREMMVRIAGMGEGGENQLGIIPQHLKKQSEDFMWSRYNPYMIYDEKYASNGRKSIRKDYFTFEIIKGREIISKSVFENKFMLYSADNQVDITNIVPDIVSEIEYTFSGSEYTTDYLETDLTFKSEIWKYGESFRA